MRSFLIAVFMTDRSEMEDSMDSFLLYPDMSLRGERPYQSFPEIYKDLSLNIILKTMSRGDTLLMEQIRTVMMVPVHSSSVLAYRYDVIKDFERRDELSGKMYELGRRGMELARQYKKEREQNRNRTAAKTSNILSSLHFVSESLTIMKDLTLSIQKEEQSLRSVGLLAFCRRLSGYPLEEFEEFHNQLQFYTTGGAGTFSIRIGGGLKIEGSLFCDCTNDKVSMPGRTSKKLLKFYYKALKKDTILIEDEELDRDIHQYTEQHMHHLMKFYKPFVEQLYLFWEDFFREISFYHGVHNIQVRMKELSLPFCYGELSQNRLHRDIEDLYELSLALYVQAHPVANSINSKNTCLTIITGANQGGKSTFLRSFGIAQILMQCGMPVPAKKFCSGLFSEIHTHFTRKEDAMLSRGRLEEELKRMSTILSQITNDSLLLFNESFASTTEKEGSQIASNIIMPCFQKKISIMMVTHLHEFARSMYEKHLSESEFLVAERRQTGERTFRMIPGKPHYSSYGTDLYHNMIEDYRAEDASRTIPD